MRSARDTARRVLGRIATEELFASDALAEDLDGLSPADRGLATELVYGVLRSQTRLDFSLDAYARKPVKKLSSAMRTVLRVAAYQVLSLDRVPDHAAINDAVSAARKVGGHHVTGFVNGLLRTLAREGQPALPEPGDAQYAEVALSMPPTITALVEEVLGAGEQSFEALESLNQSAPLWIRVNTEKGSVSAARARLKEEGATVTAEDGEALALRGLGSPDRSPSFREGLWTVQDLGAQWVARLAPKAADHVLDACAGVGGKTLHLAARYPNAVIDAVDVSSRKLARLADSMKRLGIADTRVTRITQDLLADDAELGSAYDLVVLDAPCSGLGVLRRHPELKWRFREEDIARQARRQAALLDRVAPLVRAGGCLLYSLCTFSTEEGETQAREFLARHSEFRADPGPHTSSEGNHRTWPHLSNADAFFVARFCRLA